MEQPPIRQLRTRSLPEAGAALRGAKDAILARWRATVVEALPQADELTRRQLESSIPTLLDRIAMALASDRSSAADALIAESPVHGTNRFHQDFSLNQLLIEYHVLRGVVLEEVTRALGRPLGIDEDVALNQGLDVALREAAVAFAEHQTMSMKVQADAMAKFLSFLSHDLRGGLNGAVLMLEVLKRSLTADPKFADSIEDLEIVRGSILDTVATMERFLYAERLRHGRMPVKIGPVDVADLLAEIHRGFAYQLKENAMEMEAELDPSGLTIATDRQLLMMALQNLVGNAIKYGRRGKVGVAALGPQRAGEGIACRFSVTDRGPGISPEKLTDLFAPFVQGETYGQKGMGLGLFIARQVAALLGADLRAESKPGEGSTFWLDLKRA